jgi:hypothetical protein
MTCRLAALAAPALLIAITLPVSAEPAGNQLAHPADASQIRPATITFDLFSFAVPLAERAVPIPSYGQRQGDMKAPDQAAPTDPGAMPGMDHSQMHGSGNQSGD